MVTVVFEKVRFRYFLCFRHFRSGSRREKAYEMVQDSSPSIDACLAVMPPERKQVLVEKEQNARGLFKMIAEFDREW